MLKIVEAKVSGEEIEVMEEAPAAKVVDLMDALKASVAAAKKKAASEEAERAPKKRTATRSKKAAAG